MGTATSFRSERGRKIDPPAKDLQQLLIMGKMASARPKPACCSKMMPFADDRRMVNLAGAAKSLGAVKAVLSKVTKEAHLAASTERQAK
jgi:hypothetical protein